MPKTGSKNGVIADIRYHDIADITLKIGKGYMGCKKSFLHTLVCKNLHFSSCYLFVINNINILLDRTKKTKKIMGVETGFPTLKSDITDIMLSCYLISPTKNQGKEV